MPELNTDSTMDDSYDFVDRDDILKELEHHMKKVLNENGRLILLKGEAGVGKTRIVEEFIKKVKKKNFEVLKGRCLYYESTDPYLSFFEALGDYLTEKNEESASNIVTGTASTSGTSSRTPLSLLGTNEKEEQPISDNVSLSDRREMMFNRITDIIMDLSQENPVLLFMDDLQWIDESSSQLLHHLSRHISDSRVLILGAYRPEELRYKNEELPLQATLNRMKEERLISTINVPRLDYHSITKMIKNQTQREDFPESFIWTLYRESEGNPYYVVEILNSMVNEGVINPYSYTWNPEEELSNIRIPSSIKDITERKIEKLNKDERKVLMYASLLGTEFNFEILERIMNMDVIELLDIIDSLVDQGIINEVSDSDEELYKFNHLQTRTTIYENMGKSRKRVSHRQVSKVIEDIYSNEIEDHYYELSRHFYEGKLYDKAYEYSKKAGEKALKSLDIPTALDHFEKALKSLEKSKDIDDKKEKKVYLLKMLGEYKEYTSKLDQSLNYWRSLKDLSESENDRKLKTEALYQIGHIYKEKEKYEEARENYNKSLEMSEELDYTEGVARANMGLGYINWREGDLKKAIENYKIAIEKSQEVDNEYIRSNSNVEIGNVYAHKGENDTAIDYYKEGLTYFENTESHNELARIYNNIGDQYMKKEELDTAIKFFKKEIESAKIVGNKRWVGWGSFNMAEALVKANDIDKAKHHIKRAEDIMKSLDEMIGIAAVYHVEGLIKKKEGRFEEAIDLIEEGLEINKEVDVPFNIAEFKYDLGLIYKDMGENDKAKHYLKESKEIFTELGAEHFIKWIDSELEEL